MEGLEVVHMRKRWEVALKKVVPENAEDIGKVSESCRESDVHIRKNDVARIEGIF